jgi:LPS sulfotransferase NodH
MHLYNDQFSKEHNFNENNSPNKVLIICSTQRCGSHMLGHALFETKDFGFPLEYANAVNLEEWKKRLKTSSIGETISKLQKIRTSNNSVFSIKLHYQHIEQFGTFEQVQKVFPNAYYVILSRKELLKQAISLVIADQTGVWINGQEQTSSTVTYDSKEIDRQLRVVIKENASWRYTLALTGSNYIEMNFDDVKINMPQSIKKIAGFMGLNITKTIIPEFPTTKKQSSAINKEWESRFLNEKHLVTPLHHPKSFSSKVLSKIKTR